MKERPGGRADWVALALIATAFAIGWALVAPWRNVPVIDDWVYAASVEELLRTGHLRVLGFSSVYPIAQILWGAAFAKVTGFSFGILRLSTVVLAVAGCWAVYLTLRDLAVDATLSLLAALTIALSPMFFALTFSFMTDIPFFGASSVALFLYVSAIVRGRPARLWWGSVLAVVAFLIRPLAVMLPLAAFAGIELGTSITAKNSLREMLPPLGLALIAMGIALIAMPKIFGPLPILEARSQNLRYLALVPLKQYAKYDVEGTFIAAFPFAPLLLASLFAGFTRFTGSVGRTWKTRAAAIVVVAALVTVATRLIFGIVPTPLPDFQTFSLQGIASRAGLFFGDMQPSAWSIRVMPALRILGAVVVAALAVALFTLSSQPSALSSQLSRGRAAILTFGLLHLVAINILWFFDDRYYLVLAPTLAYIAAASLTTSGAQARAVTRRTVMVAVPVLAVWAFFAISGTREALATGDIVAGLVEDLEAQGIAASDIDAGYTSNGWRLYAHPENLPADESPENDVPFVTSDRVARYAIVNAPGPHDDVLKVVSLPEVSWQASDRMYVVRRRSE